MSNIFLLSPLYFIDLIICQSGLKSDFFFLIIFDRHVFFYFYFSMSNTESTVWEYNWIIHYSPILLRLLAVALGLLSFFSFLGVISTMSGVSNASSAYYLAVHSKDSTFNGVLIFILVTMGYAVYTSLWALFQMQFFGMMHLVPHRTSAICLSFNSRMIARLAAPMAFFYLGES